MLKIKNIGDFKNTSNFLTRIKKPFTFDLLEKYGEEGVTLLASVTPIDSGKTANSWYYKIENTDGKASLIFLNSNVNDNVNIAIILQYGHATKNGGWVEGINYINPIIQPLYNKILNELWKGE